LTAGAAAAALTCLQGTLHALRSTSFNNTRRLKLFYQRVHFNTSVTGFILAELLTDSAKLPVTMVAVVSLVSITTCLLGATTSAFHLHSSSFSGRLSAPYHGKLSVSSDYAEIFVSE
jgi:hypothetical protein